MLVGMFKKGICDTVANVRFVTVNFLKEMVF